MHRFGLSVALASLVALLALPSGAADNGFYLGASVGQATVEIDDLDDALDNTDFSGDDMAYKVFAGFRFLNFLGVEGSYRDLGSADDTIPALGGTVAADVTGYDAFAVGYLPLGIADIFLKAGMISWDAELSADLLGGPVTLSDDGTDPAYGIGFQFRFSSFALRGELEYLDIEGASAVYMYSVGGSFTF